MKHVIGEGFYSFVVEVEPKNSIIVQREGQIATKFKIGDTAEYGSYNMKYTGIIRSITDKTITIEAYPGTQNARKHRLKLYEFSWRNWNFCAEDVAQHNYLAMMNS